MKQVVKGFERFWFYRRIVFKAVGHRSLIMHAVQMLVVCFAISQDKYKEELQNVFVLKIFSMYKHF